MTYCGIHNISITDEWAACPQCIADPTWLGAPIPGELVAAIGAYCSACQAWNDAPEADRPITRRRMSAAGIYLTQRIHAVHTGEL